MIIDLHTSSVQETETASDTFMQNEPRSTAKNTHKATSGKSTTHTRREAFAIFATSDRRIKELNSQWTKQNR